ncbi:hypothetical protein SSX86_018009 [Deinandra increscens subsp. villosa]|uniref:PGG domain-containing protein n=1 Tax=Deinandra increscens subsp. villosa TaxID=3103831 RepID=A0AAP0GXK2_9ASTR
MDDEGLEKEVLTKPNCNILVPSPSSTSAPELVLKASGKKKYVKQVTGRHNDTELLLHLAAKQGDLASVKHILDEIISQIPETSSGADFRASMVNQVNERGETALYAAAENGHLEVVKELLKYAEKETLTRRSCLEFDPLHIAASQGHHARSGHVDTVRILLEKEPQLARKMDKQGQTALHMAVKGASSEVVKLLLEADAAIVMLPDKSGLTALHVATRKKRAEIVNQLLSLPETNVNALTKAHKTALDIAEGLSSSKKSTDIRASLVGRGAVRANQLNQPRDEFRNSVTEIKNDIHLIAKDVKKFHHEGNNNNPVTLAVLLAAMALAVLITVPGDDQMAHGTCFKILFIFDMIALYTSLAVVVIHMTLGIRGENKRGSSRVVVERLMWLACVCTSVAFMVSAYIIMVGRKNEWVAAVSVTVFGGAIMVVALGTMAYNVVRWERNRSMIRKEKIPANRVS